MKRKWIEIVAQGLTIISFVALCWVVHRSLQVRTQCVNSSFISFVQINKEHIDNCHFESRLNLSRLFNPIPQETLKLVRQVEVLEPLTDLFPVLHPGLAVEINLDQPHLFELGRNYVRLGSDWLTDKVQTRRALIMGVLKHEQPENYENAFQLETMTDFIMMAVMSEDKVSDHSVAEIKFSTSAPSFAEYCKSPFRSLAHREACAFPGAESEDLQANVWGFRPLLAAALYRVFNKSTLNEKLKALQAIAAGQMMPKLGELEAANDLPALVLWFGSTLHEHLEALKLDGNEQSVKSTLKELEVESPTHWELTVDITNTPAWKDILEQFKTWSRFHQKDRTLVFTPEGAVAFPSGLPVGWNSQDVQSQKHVLIACHWPKPADMINVVSRHVFARQSCGKVDEVFWN